MAQELNYQNIATLAAGSLPRYLTRPGSRYGLVNEVRPRTALGARLLKRAKISWDTGITLKFGLKLRRSRTGQWMGATTKLAPRPTQAATHGEVPRRFYGNAWYKSHAELDHNKGEKEVVVDILKEAYDDVAVDQIIDFEDTIGAADGNYAHDGSSGADFLMPFGIHSLLTIDGLHITGASRNVCGINPTTEALWRNPYINPVASSDNLGVASSVVELREYMERMALMLNWQSLDAWKQITPKLADDRGDDLFEKDEDPNSDYMIVADKKTVIKYGSLVFDREDNVSGDQGRGRRTWKGIPIFNDDHFGIDASYGYGFDSAGTAMWTDRGGSYASGNWKGTGWMDFINTYYVGVLIHPQHAPYVKKPYEPEGMFGIAMENDWWLQLCILSRQRGGGVIAGYAFPT